MRARALLLIGVLLGLAASAAPAARIVAVGDVHGEIDGFDSVLRAARLIDEAGRWVGGDATLVQTGDVTDRGPRVRAVMDRLRSLELQAPAQGGRVIALLGNHEISVMSHLFDETSTPREIYHQTWADFAGAKAERNQKRAYQAWHRWWQTYPGCVKAENRAWAETRSAWLDDHPIGFVEFIEAMSPDGEYGAWLRGKNLAAEVDGSLFLHGGISPKLLADGYRSVEAVNEAARQVIEQFDRDRKRLVEEGVILSFSSLWETHCAVFVEMFRLEKNGQPQSLQRRAGLAEINDRLPGMAGWLLTQEDGPLWYRGLANGEEAALERHVGEALAAFGARRIALGHTPQPSGIRARFGGRVFLIDTAMAYPELGGRAAALEIAGDRVTAVYPDERVDLTPPAAGGGEPAAGETEPRARPAEAGAGNDQPPVEGSNGNGQPPVEGTNGHGDDARTGSQVQEAAPESGAETLDDAPVADEDAADRTQVWLDEDGEPLPFRTVEEVLDFLANARIVATEAIKVGVTLPDKLTLERDGVRAHAIFHTIEIEKRRERLHGGKVVNFFRDHYANNIAAFELSRLLGMHNVPPAVVRRVGRRRGSVQLWIERSRTEADRREQGFEAPGSWRLSHRDMQVFDNLINNIDRNQGNILYDAEWNLWFIDHTRTFGRLKQLPSPTRVRRCSRRLHQALRALDEETLLQRLRPHIGIYEIRGLLARRDLLLDLIEQRIAETSEVAVLFDYDQATVEALRDESDPEIPEDPTSEAAGDAG